jgi:hypothetical protein
MSVAPEVVELLHRSMNLLNQVQEKVDDNQLDKAFWINLGIFYKGYQINMPSFHDDHLVPKDVDDVQS